MEAMFWIAVVVALLTTYTALWGMVTSYIAGLRGEDKLEGFKTGALFGPLGAAIVLFKKDSVPDIEVNCPHCGTHQEVSGTLRWFECWECEERSDIAPHS